jgi:pimeloyl-ACP methyl ester carboxylesterase
MPTADGLAYTLYNGGPQTTTRPPFVLLHGAGGSRLHWPAQLRRLKGEQVFSLDLPGHGRSTRGPCSTIEKYSEALISWMDSVGLPAASLMGHSMGGAIALQTALDAPQRVASLWLVGSGAKLRVNRLILDLVSWIEEHQQVVDLVIELAFHPDATPELVEEARKNMLAGQPETLHADFSACDVFDVRGVLKKISIPTGIFCGDADRLTPVGYSDFLAENIPGAKLHLIENAGHMVMLERPDELAAQILLMRAFEQRLVISREDEF